LICPWSSSTSHVEYTGSGITLVGWEPASWEPVDGEPAGWEPVDGEPPLSGTAYGCSQDHVPLRPERGRRIVGGAGGIGVGWIVASDGPATAVVPAVVVVVVVVVVEVVVVVVVVAGGGKKAVAGTSCVSKLGPRWKKALICAIAV